MILIVCHPQETAIVQALSRGERPDQSTGTNSSHANQLVSYSEGGDVPPNNSEVVKEVLNIIMVTLAVLLVGMLTEFSAFVIAPLIEVLGLVARVGTKAAPGGTAVAGVDAGEGVADAAAGTAGRGTANAGAGVADDGDDAASMVTSAGDHESVADSESPPDPAGDEEQPSPADDVEAINHPDEDVGSEGSQASAPGDTGSQPGGPGNPAPNSEAGSHSISTASTRGSQWRSRIQAAVQNKNAVVKKNSEAIGKNGPAGKSSSAFTGISSGVSAAITDNE